MPHHAIAGTYCGLTCDMTRIGSRGNVIS
jgi:hypothetical protein